MAYPNPSAGAPIVMHVMGGPFDKVKITIYTISMRKIYEATYTGNGQPTMDIPWDLKDSYSRVTANGLYYVLVESYIHGTDHRSVQKVLILR